MVETRRRTRLRHGPEQPDELFTATITGRGASSDGRWWFVCGGAVDSDLGSGNPAIRDTAAATVSSSSRETIDGAGAAGVSTMEESA